MLKADFPFPFLWVNVIFRIEDSVREDLAILKNSPLLKKGTQFVGLKFDTDTGKLTVVE